VFCRAFETLPAMNLFGRKKAAPGAPAAPSAAAAPAAAAALLDTVTANAKLQESYIKRQEYLTKQMEQLAKQAVEKSRKGDKKGE